MRAVFFQGNRAKLQDNHDVFNESLRGQKKDWDYFASEAGDAQSDPQNRWTAVATPQMQCEILRHL
jgi:hypothetical protein